MGNSAATISIQLEAQTATLKKGFDEAKGAINNLSASMGSSVAKGMAVYNAGLFAVQKVLGTVQGAIASVNEAMDRMGEEVDISDRLGMTADALETLKFAADQTGASGETVVGALEKMKNAVSEAAQGTGAGEKAIRELGLSVSALQAMSPDEQFAAFADALQGVSSEGDKTRLIMDIFGKSGTQLKNILAGGSEGLNEFGKQAEQMGLLLGDARKVVDDAGDSIAAMKAAWSAMWDQVAIAAAPVIKWIADSINKMISDLNWLLGNTTGAQGKAKEFADIKTKVSITDPAAEKAIKDAEEKAKKAADEMKERAKSIAESVRTPMEEFQARMSELNNLVQSGAISWEVYRRAAKDAAKPIGELHKTVKDMATPAIGVATLSSAEGFSAVHSAERQRQDEERRHKEQIAHLERIESAVRNTGLVLAPVNI